MSDVSPEVNWHKLGPDMTTGSSPDEEITLYRGFPAHQLDPERGLLSDAAIEGAVEIIQDVVAASEEGDWVRVIDHMQVGFKSSREKGRRTGDKPTPFIYTGDDKHQVTRSYGTGENHRVATIVVPANRIVVSPMGRDLLVLGLISMDEIIKLEKGPTPQPKPQEEFQLPSVDLAKITFDL